MKCSKYDILCSCEIMRLFGCSLVTFVADVWSTWKRKLYLTGRDLSIGSYERVCWVNRREMARIRLVLLELRAVGGVKKVREVQNFSASQESSGVSMSTEHVNGKYNERLMGPMTCLRKMIGIRKVSLMILITLLYEMVATINRRLLTLISDQTEKLSLVPSTF